MSSLAASVRRNQFSTTRKKILLRGTVKSAISDVSASFWTHLRSNPTLESLGQTSLLLQRQLWGYKTLDPTTKHQKAIPAKLVLHIYKRTNTHLNTSIDQLITGAFSFGIRSYKYSTTTKGEDKRIRILQKRVYIFTENATHFHTTVGSSIWPIRSPRHSAHRKTGSKTPQ